ncbi:MAG: acyl-CoA dehydrogenase family protein [Pseudomonadota bacterium]
MNFDDTPEEEKFRASARAWLAENKFDYGSVVQDGKLFAAVRKWQKIKQEAGWGCLHWPKKYGGQDASPIQNLIFGQEEDAAGMAPLSVSNAITIGMAAATVMHCGTDAQKERHLPKIARGEEIWCQLFSEPVAGSDLAGIKTRAEKDGDGWVVNGQKVWTSFAQYSDWAILVTRSDSTALKHKGLTYFLLDMKSPGVEVRPIKQASGGSDFNEVFLDNVRIPDANRVGEVGDGWRVALTTLMNERAAISSAFPTNFEDAWALSKQTPLGDGAAIEDSAVRSMLADWYVWYQGLKNFSLRLQSDLSQGKTPGPEASAGKLLMGARRQSYISEALDLMDVGGPALSSANGAGWHFAFFRVIGNRIEGGSDEVLRNIIGERVLGLPTEPRVDKNTPFNEIPTSL